MAVVNKNTDTLRTECWENIMGIVDNNELGMNAPTYLPTSLTDMESIRENLAREWGQRSVFQGQNTRSKACKHANLYSPKFCIYLPASTVLFHVKYGETTGGFLSPV